ncbi:MAG: DNA topoisomerase IV subunit B [Rhodospirillales bacterium RIFCSPLOWO2_12_FULL_58_28]|nr:MAG: DNA topoisomerase IV subunit B [Rhodospirillales bacterium RIFCSPLOWO2_02_FULL_58_16]OHC78182.1 MAG: DNA topoisomerase IV subunit B [Rhodospirillales bacterium RIFCSPLOWO2_12_FULL_58_28]
MEVLEGLEPVRLRPGMFIGGTDERALHHLAAEVIDNSMDEAVAGHAGRIDIELKEGNILTISDNGRGIPVDPHPKFKNKSALEVILTTLHSGGKFSGKVYETSGGLHGVGVSVVNALSDYFLVQVARDRNLWSQSYSRGRPEGPLKNEGAVQNRRGTTVTFHPDPQIFGAMHKFRPALLYRMARSKAYLFRGVEIRWLCDPSLIKGGDDTPPSDTLHFPGGLTDFLNSTLKDCRTLTSTIFSGQAKLNGGSGKVEWAAAWTLDEDEFFNSYCNTIPTTQGGTHEMGLRSALTKGLKAYGELTNNKQAAKITAEDVVSGARLMLSVFIPDPQFQGQTKEKLSTPEAARLVEAGIRDHFDHWLSGDTAGAKALLDHVIERADERNRRRKSRETKRASATRRLRLPGKLTDCTCNTADGAELFIVEGDSAGGSAKQARERLNQAILPLRGKILNVASATAEKMMANQELRDLIEAMGCGSGKTYDDAALRYEKIIIMTDADVDGAHIASLLMTFFFREMPKLIENNHLYLAMPPLYRISQGGKTMYARDDAHKEELLKKQFTGRSKIEISRFKGLGEMPSNQLKETTMSPANRTLLRVTIPTGHSSEEIVEAKNTADLVESLMGRKPELRLAFIQENARFTGNIDI